MEARRLHLLLTSTASTEVFALVAATSCSIDAVVLRSSCLEINGVELLEELCLRFPQMQFIVHCEGVPEACDCAEYFAAGAGMCCVSHTIGEARIRGLLLERPGAMQVDLRGASRACDAAIFFAAAGAVALLVAQADLMDLAALGLAVVLVVFSVPPDRVFEMTRVGAAAFALGSIVTSSRRPASVAARYRAKLHEEEEEASLQVELPPRASAPPRPAAAGREAASSLCDSLLAGLARFQPCSPGFFGAGNFTLASAAPSSWTTRPFARAVRLALGRAPPRAP